MADAWNKLRSRITLFFLFVSQLVRRLTGRTNRHGLERFLSQYASDGVTAITERERARFPAYQRCQACSQCTFSCVAIREGRAHPSWEPKWIMLAQGRSAHEAQFQLPEQLPCLQCEICTVTCPNDVPLHEMAELVRNRARGYSPVSPG